MEWNSLVWLGLIAAFLITEAACPIHLVSVWFAAGSLAALLTGTLGGPLWLQVTVFILVSGALLALLWPLTKKYLNPGHTATNIDTIPGSLAVVTVPIDNVAAQGQVKLNGMDWTARSTSGQDLPEGIRVRVDRVEGVKLYVSPAQSTADIQ